MLLFLQPTYIRSLRGADDFCRFESENPGSSVKSEYSADSPSKDQDNGSNTTRRRAVDLSISHGSDASKQRQNSSDDQLASSTTIGVGQPLRITREPVRESRFQSYQAQGQPGIVDARRAAAAPNTGQRLLLRRRNPPRTGSQSAAGQAGPFRGRASRGGDGNQRHRRRRESENRQEDDDEDPLSVRERMFGIKPEPKPVPYEPKGMTMEELRLDWPATAIDGRGSTESVQQKLEFLAKRLPHGWLSPQELAERLHKGQMVHFESDEERKEVLVIAAELAQSRADTLTERKGEHIPPEDMSFADITAEEKERLAAKMVKGEYPGLQTHKLPFLNQVQRNLRNNGTYHEMETSKFMEKIQSLLPANRGGQQAQKRS